MTSDSPKDTIENGTRRVVGGEERIWFDGYWIRYYAPPPESWAEKKRLIEGLTRRLFHHTEPGINTPGENLDLARAAFERESDPARKRVNGAMLAGALYNRAADIIAIIVELEAKGIAVARADPLMREVGRCFREALELGRNVRHYSGHEGIDELWGEPLKALTMSLHDFYESRYVKIALTMRDIDTIADRMVATFRADAAFDGVEALVRDHAEAARLESETLRRDPTMFEVWPRFVAASERIESFRPDPGRGATAARRRQLREGRRLLVEGKDLLGYIAGARVPMPKSTRHYLDALAEYAREADAA